METYSTLNCGMKVSDRVFTTQQNDAQDIPYKYIIKDSNGKLLCQIIFSNKDKEIEGVLDEDLRVILLDREQIKARAKV